MKIIADTNIWYGLGQEQGDKYWTREKRWINLIKKAGCENYLYIENQSIAQTNALDSCN